jgi:hypothetical protein
LFALRATKIRVLVAFSFDRLNQSPMALVRQPSTLI